jgi:hypothetical protein
MSAPTSIPSVSSPLLAAPVQASLPITSEARAPAAVREGSSAAKQAYATGQGFEEMLLQQLSQALAQGGGLGGEGAGGGFGEEEEEAEGASPVAGGGELQSLMPQALAEGIMREGGIGLATQLMNTLDPAAASRPQSGAPVTAAAATGAATQGGVTVAPTNDISAAVAPSSGGGTGGTSA